jgi:hypothetical protein
MESGVAVKFTQQVDHVDLGQPCLELSVTKGEVLSVKRQLSSLAGV